MCEEERDLEIEEKVNEEISYILGNMFINHIDEHIRSTALSLESTHRHIIALLGYCDDAAKKGDDVCVKEYATSLDRYHEYSEFLKKLLERLKRIRMHSSEISE